MNRRRIFTQLLGSLDADDYCTCPGQANHTNANGARDCKVYGLDAGAPTIYCVHLSCAGAVDDANYKLRRAIALDEMPELRSSKGGGLDFRPKTAATWTPPTRSEIDQAALAAEEAALEAEEALPGILRDYQWDFADSAPIPADPDDQFDKFLSLFREDDVLWIANNNESGEGYASSFAPVKSWRMRGLTDRVQTSPYTFQPGSLSRCKVAAVTRRYLVFESDTLPGNEQAAVLNYLRTEMGLPLVMVVFTGSKSYHGWFDASAIDPTEMDELKALMTGARPVTQTPSNPSIRGWHTGLGGCPSMFVISQPVRLPGPINSKTQRRQSIVWLSK